MLEAGGPVRMVGILEEGHVWSGRSSCVGDAFEPPQGRCQLGCTLY